MALPQRLAGHGAQQPRPRRDSSADPRAEISQGLPRTRRQAGLAHDVGLARWRSTSSKTAIAGACGGPTTASLPFIVNERGRPEAANGKHDDLVMAAAMGWGVLACPTAFRSFSNLPEA